jgi:hypothetical protein
MRKLILTAVLTMSTFAAADPGKTAGQLASDDCAKQRKAGKTCVLSIESEDVNGSAPSGSDVGVALLQFKSLGSLIRIRHDFIPELIKSAEDL